MHTNLEKMNNCVLYPIYAPFLMLLIMGFANNITSDKLQTNAKMNSQEYPCGSSSIEVSRLSDNLFSSTCLYVSSSGLFFLANRDLQQESINPIAAIK